MAPNRQKREELLRTPSRSFAILLGRRGSGVQIASPRPFVSNSFICTARSRTASRTCRSRWIPEAPVGILQLQIPLRLELNLQRISIGLRRDSELECQKHVAEPPVPDAWAALSASSLDHAPPGIWTSPTKLGLSTSAYDMTT